MNQYLLLVLIPLAISTVLGIVSTIIYHYSPKDEKSNGPFSIALRIINQLFTFFFILFTVLLLIWLSSLIIHSKSIFF